MKNKIILAIIGAIAIVAVVSSIVFAGTSSNSMLKLEDPTEIVFYYNSQTAKMTLKQEDADYQEFMSAYKNAFKKSSLEQLNTGEFVGDGATEQTDENEWSEYNKNDGLFAELKFKGKQKLKIYRDGNSRVLNITSIIFRVEQTPGVHDILIYYSIDNLYKNDPSKTGDQEVYYPLTIQGETRELYSLIREYLSKK